MFELSFYRLSVVHALKSSAIELFSFLHMLCPLLTNAQPSSFFVDAAEHAAALTAMANNPIDVEPLLPRGFIICNRSQEEGTPQRVYAFLSTSVRCINENVAIAMLDLEVAPVGYPHVANTIYGFLVNTLLCLSIRSRCCYRFPC
jgi:hypothetical protein